MKADLIIKNGTVIDGTGAPPRRADVAITQGRIAEIGDLSVSADRTIDADGRIVAPGFVDPHTHYDAQIWWDSDLTPSPWHGVTSVVMGNCGVGIAPCAAGARDAAMHDLVNVEGIPYEVMAKGIDWQWESLPQFIDAAKRRDPAINIGFLAPLTPLRYHVMGEAAVERAATEAETDKIRDLLDEGMAAGMLGFSTTLLPNHAGHLGRPLACKQASRDELRAYSNVLRRRKAGSIEIALTQRASVLTDDDLSLLDFLLTESGRPITWLSLVTRDDAPNACDESLAKGADVIRRGARPQITPMPLTREIDLHEPFSFQGFKSWHAVLNKSIEEQVAIYGSAEFRARFRRELANGGTSFTGNWNLMRVNEVGDPSLRRFENMTIADIALETGSDGIDALLDLAILDKLRTTFVVGFLNTDEKGIAKLMNNPDTLIGLSDGGAHLGMLCDAGYCTFVLGTWVRERGIMPIERAIKRLTSEPADFFGITDRGRLKPGLAADIVIFDPATIGSAKRGERRHDLPGGAKRIVMPSQGIDYTIVNGTVVYEQGQMTGARAGVALRPHA